MRLVLVLLASLLTSAPAFAQQVIQQQGTVRHGSADVSFPERVGEFRRTQVITYSADRSNMSANYSLALPGGRLVISIYVYPARTGRDRAALCAAEFDGVIQSIAQAYGGARQIERGPPPPVEGVPPTLSHRATHAVRLPFDGETRDITSESRLYCDVGGPWLVKYRASAYAPFPDGTIDEFIAQGPWPGRAAAVEPCTVAP